MLADLLRHVVQQHRAERAVHETLCDIDRGQAVIKYAHPIGVATVPIARGAHVHRHNVVSPNQNTEVRP